PTSPVCSPTPQPHAPRPHQHVNFSPIQYSDAHRDLHSFPTRRSSDLPCETTPCAPAVSCSPCPKCRTCSSPCRSNTPTGACAALDRKSTRLNSSHVAISYAVFCLKKETTYLALLHAGPLALHVYEPRG